MKTGMTLQEMAIELERQQSAKKDLLVDTRAISVLTKDGVTKLNATNGHVQAFGVKEHAHRQIADRLKIPFPYYDRLRSEVPHLLDTNVNTLLHEKPEKRMVRTLDGNVRGYLSNKYRRLDNFDLAEHVLPILHGAPTLRIESTQLTDTRFYIKATFPKIEGEVTVGDVVQAGVCIRNSEVGHGKIAVDPLVFRLSCKNGMVSADYGMQRHHVGKRVEMEEGEEVLTMFRDETIAADDKAFFMKIQDTVRAAMTDVQFRQLLDRMKEAAGEKITGDPIAAVEVLSTKLALSTREGGGVLRHLIEGKDLSRWGVVNALTAFSQEVDDYDRASEFEILGGKVLELPKNDWDSIAEADRKSRRKGKLSLSEMVEA